MRIGFEIRGHLEFLFLTLFCFHDRIPDLADSLLRQHERYHFWPHHHNEKIKYHNKIVKYHNKRPFLSPSSPPEALALKH